MPRKGPPPRRDLMPDPIYRSVLVTQVVNKILQRGKRALAERTVYRALDIVHDKTGQEPLAALKRAVENVKPQLEVKSRRVGGATYQVPVEVRPERRRALAIRWLINAARARREHHDGEAGRRAPRRLQQPRHRGEEARGHAQDGRGQPRLLALPLVIPI